MLATALGALVCLAVAASGEAAPGSNAHLEAAEAQVNDLHYSEAAKSLAKARADAGNSRATLLRILELTGVVEGSRGHAKQASAAFSALLFLDPTHAPGDDWGPKVQTPFYEARGWMGDHHPFSAKAGAPALEDGRATSVSIELGEDPLHLYDQVRVHFSADGADSAAQAPAVPGPVVVPAPKADRLTWWAEVLGKNSEVLGSVGEASAPQVIDATPKPAPPPPEVAAAPPAPPPKHAAAAAVAAPVESGPRYRPAAYGLMVGGVLVLGGATVFGVMFRSDQSQLNNAARNGQGQITGLSQTAAYNLNSGAKTDGLLADIGWGVGGLALAAGVGLWFFGGQVAVAPTTNGAVVAGNF